MQNKFCYIGKVIQQLYVTLYSISKDYVPLSHLSISYLQVSLF